MIASKQSRVSVSVALLLAVVALAGALPDTASAQAFPSRPLRLIYPYAAGSGPDVLGRMISVEAAKLLGQPIIFENRPGAQGRLGLQAIREAPPDGHMLSLINDGVAISQPAQDAEFRLDPGRDYAPVSLLFEAPLVLLARPDLPFRDMKGFVAYARANPGKLNYGSGGVGATSHLTCLFLDSLLETKPTHVPFRGSGPALNALIGGQVDYVCDQTVGIVPSIQGKMVNGLVAAVPARLSSLPDMPTSTEEGLPAFQAVGWNALFAPKGTPKAIVDKINAAARAALNDTMVKTRLLELSVELPAEDAKTPEALKAFVAKEIDKWVPIIKKAGVTAQ